MPVFVTFDIDGTLVHSKKAKELGKEPNRLHRDALSHALQAVCGVRAEVNEVPHHGCTDRGILMDMMRLRGVEPTEDLLKEIVSGSAAYKADADWGEGLATLPGVVSLLEALHTRSDVVVALVTGNVCEIAWRKMDGAKIGHLFTDPRFGGFGGDFNTRAECIRHANSVARERFGEPTASFHVGDAPSDVSAAVEAGVTPIGVLTGIFSREQLQSAAPDGEAAVFETLSDTKAVLEAMGVA